MKKIIFSVIGLALMLGLVGVASAITTTVVLDNPVIAGADAIVDPSNSYIGNGSWKNDSNGVKMELYLLPALYFGEDIRISDIEEISYYTHKDDMQGGKNFYINIYTEPYSGGSSSWYGSRLTLEPMYSKEFNDAINVWNKWSTNSGTNQLTIFDQPRSGAYGWYYPPTLGEIQTGPINWNDYLNTAPETDIDYTNEIVKYIVLDTGSAWDAGFEGNVDLLSIVVNGDTVIFDFEAPVPRSAEITSPLAGEEVSGIVSFEAYLNDNDIDAIQWAVRQGTCAANTNTVFGNVDGHSDTATIDASDLSHQAFSFSADMSSLPLGMYCFVYNPVEDSGESNIRKTVEFNLKELLIGPPTDKDQCKKDGWKTFNNPFFKNQGDCVSYVQSNENAEGNRKDN